MEDVFICITRPLCLFVGYLVNCLAIWYILWLFGIFFPFWIVVLKQIWHHCNVLTQCQITWTQSLNMRRQFKSCSQVSMNFGSIKSWKKICLFQSLRLQTYHLPWKALISGCIVFQSHPVLALLSRNVATSSTYAYFYVGSCIYLTIPLYPGGIRSHDP
jgi:hypothetical protein